MLSAMVICTWSMCRLFHDGSKHSVREAQRKDVLHRLLPQVVVDAVDRGRPEHAFERRAEGLRASEVVSEWFLHHHPAPPVCSPVQAGDRKLVADRGERGGRNRQVEDVVVGLVAADVELAQPRGQRCECGRVVERTLYQVDPLGQRCPHHRVERCARVRDHRIVKLGFGVCAVVGEADEIEARRQLTTVREVVDGRDQFLAGEITGDSEDHHRRRLGDLPGIADQRLACKPVRAACQRVSRLHFRHRHLCCTPSFAPPLAHSDNAADTSVEGSEGKRTWSSGQ
jgi:hypothetical protein